MDMARLQPHTLSHIFVDLDISPDLSGATVSPAAEASTRDLQLEGGFRGALQIDLHWGKCWS